MTATRPGGRSARVRAAVMDAALDELAARGVDGFSIESVAARAGVHKASIYRRWGGVYGLIRDVVRDLPVDNAPPPNHGSLREDLVAYVAGFLELADERAIAVSAAIEHAARRDAEIAQLSRELFEARSQAVETMLDRAAERGELVRRVDAALLLTILFAGAAAAHGRDSSRAVATSVVDLVLEPMAKPAGSRKRAQRRHVQA